MESCNFFIEKKGKQCKLPAVHNSEYCYSHNPFHENTLICPIDLKQPIKKNQILSHLNVCNKARDYTTEASLPFFHYSCNIERVNEKISVFSSSASFSIEQLKTNPERLQQYEEVLISLYEKCIKEHLLTDNLLNDILIHFDDSLPWYQTFASSAKKLTIHSIVKRIKNYCHQVVHSDLIPLNEDICTSTSIPVSNEIQELEKALAIFFQWKFSNINAQAHSDNITNPNVKAKGMTLQITNEKKQFKEKNSKDREMMEKKGYSKAMNNELDDDEEVKVIRKNIARFIEGVAVENLSEALMRQPLTMLLNYMDCHEQQNLHLIYLSLQSNLISPESISDNFYFVELGAGKAELSRFARVIFSDLRNELSNTEYSQYLEKNNEGIKRSNGIDDRCRSNESNIGGKEKLVSKREKEDNNEKELNTFEKKEKLKAEENEKRKDEGNCELLEEKGENAIDNIKKGKQNPLNFQSSCCGKYLVIERESRRNSWENKITPTLVQRDTNVFRLKMDISNFDGDAFRSLVLQRANLYNRRNKLAVQMDVCHSPPKYCPRWIQVFCNHHKEEILLERNRREKLKTKRIQDESLLSRINREIHAIQEKTITDSQKIDEKEIESEQGRKESFGKKQREDDMRSRDHEEEKMFVKKVEDKTGELLSEERAIEKEGSNDKKKGKGDDYTKRDEERERERIEKIDGLMVQLEDAHQTVKFDNFDESIYFDVLRKIRSANEKLINNSWSQCSQLFNLDLIKGNDENNLKRDREGNNRASQHQNESTPIIFYCAKHLCGGGIDVSLRACLGRSQQCSINEQNHQEIFKENLGQEEPLEINLEKDSEIKEKNQIEQILMLATCCHHRCDLNSFLGLDYLMNKNHISPDFVQTMFAVSSWNSNNECKHKMRLGRMTKRILDASRIYWLRTHFSSKSSYQTLFTANNISPENSVIIAQL